MKWIMLFFLFTFFNCSVNSQRDSLSILYCGYDNRRVISMNQLIDEWNNPEFSKFKVFQGGTIGVMKVNKNIFTNVSYSYSLGSIDNEAFVEDKINLKRYSFSEMSLEGSVGYNLILGRLIISPGVGGQCTEHYIIKRDYQRSSCSVTGTIERCEYTFDDVSLGDNNLNIYTTGFINFLIKGIYTHLYLKPYFRYPIFQSNFSEALNSSEETKLSTEAIFYGIEIGIGIGTQDN